MEMEIEGKVYKDIPVVKMIVNGKEINGNVISAEDASNDPIIANIITEAKE